MDFQSWFSRTTRGDRLLMVSLIIALINCFPTWWMRTCGGGGTAGIPETCGTFGSGFNGVGWLYFLVVLVLIALFVVRNFLASSVQVGTLPLRDAQIYLAGGAVLIVISLLYWLEYHSTDVVLGFSVTAGPWIGLVIGLLAGIGVLIAGLLKQREPELPTSYAARNPTPGGGYGGGGGGGGYVGPGTGAGPGGGYSPSPPIAPPQGAPQQPPRPPAPPQGPPPQGGPPAAPPRPPAPPQGPPQGPPPGTPSGPAQG